MASSEPREVVERYLPSLLEYLRSDIPALAARPLLASLVTALAGLGLNTLFAWRERVRRSPIVPYALGHRPTRRELAAFIRRQPELAVLRSELAAAEAADGGEARRRWDDLRRRVGEAQADLAAPLAGRREAVARIDGFLTALLRAGTVDLSAARKRALLALVRERLADGA